MLLAPEEGEWSLLGAGRQLKTGKSLPAMGNLSNKGGVGVGFRLHGTSFAAVRPTVPCGGHSPACRLIGGAADRLPPAVGLERRRGGRDEVQARQAQRPGPGDDDRPPAQQLLGPGRYRLRGLGAPTPSWHGCRPTDSADSKAAVRLARCTTLSSSATLTTGWTARSASTRPLRRSPLLAATGRRRRWPGRR